MDRSIPHPPSISDTYRKLSNVGVSYMDSVNCVRSLKLSHLGIIPTPTINSLTSTLNKYERCEVIVPVSIPACVFIDPSSSPHITGLGGMISSFPTYADYRVQEVIVSYMVWLRDGYDAVRSSGKIDVNGVEECYGTYLSYAFKEFVKAAERVVVEMGIVGRRTGEVARMGRRGDVEEILKQRWGREAVPDTKVNMDEDSEEAEWGWISYEDDNSLQNQDNSNGDGNGDASIMTIPPPSKPQHWPSEFSPLTGTWMLGGMDKERKETSQWSHRIAHEYMGSIEYERGKKPGWEEPGVTVIKTLKEKAEDVMGGKTLPQSDLDFTVYTYLTTLPLNLPIPQKFVSTMMKSRLERVLTYLKLGSPWSVVERLSVNWNDVIEWRLQGIYEHHKGGSVDKYREWRRARGEVLTQAAKGVEDGDVNTARVLLTIIGQEIIQALEDGFKDLIKTLTGVADIILDWGDGGEAWGEVFNSFFDLISGIPSDSVNDLALKIWRDDKERLMFEYQEVEAQEEDIRFTPGVMVKTKSKIDDVFDTPMVKGKHRSLIDNDGNVEEEFKVKISGAPFKWRAALCEALGEKATKIGFNKYRGNFGGRPVSYKSATVTLPMDGVKLTIKCDGEMMELEAKSSCGFSIDGVRVKVMICDKCTSAFVDVGIVDIYSVKETADRRYRLPPVPFASFDIVTEIAVFHDLYSPGTKVYADKVEVEFWRRLRPCKRTDWCMGGDGESFREVWSAMSEAKRWKLRRLGQGGKDGKNENWNVLDYAEVNLDKVGIASDKKSTVVSLQEPMLKVTGWAFTTTLCGARIFVVLTTSVNASSMEVRCNRKDVSEAWSEKENVREGLIRWVTKGMWGFDGLLVPDFASGGIDSNISCF